jgi:hypothetical protein
MIWAMVKGVRFLKPLCLALQYPVVPEDPFYGSLMEFQVKTVEHFFSNCRSRQTELGPLVDDVANDLRGYLVGFGFTFRLVCQACEAFSMKGFHGLVEGLPGVAELLAHLGNEASLMAVSAKHLVFDLAPVMGLKEIRVMKQCRLDSFAGSLHGRSLSFSVYR